jgi:hypothetical protein
MNQLLFSGSAHLIHRVRSHTRSEEISMKKHFLVAVVGTALGLISSTGFALAETFARYQCNIIGAVNLGPVGDRDGHLLRSVQFSCLGVDGVVKDAVYTGASIVEWDGPQGKYLSAGGIVRAPEGLAVTQLTEGKGSMVMKDGKPAGAEASGKAQFKFASGTLAALSGKAFKFETKPTGVGRFSIEYTELEQGSVGMSRQ